MKRKSVLMRLAKGLKQSEPVELTEVEDKTIRRIEVGEDYPSIDLLVRMAKALDCELIDFVNFSDKATDSLNEVTKQDLNVIKKFMSLLYNKIK